MKPPETLFSFHDIREPKRREMIMAPNTTANPNIRFKNRRDHTRRVAFMCGFLPAIALLLTLCLGPNPLTMGQSAALTPMIAELTDIPDPTPLVRLDYPNVLGETPLSLARGGLYLNVENNTADPLIVSVESRSISGSVDGTRMVQQLSLAPFYKISLILDPSLMPVAKDSEAFASQFLLTGYVFDSAGRLLRKEQAPELFYHRDAGGVLYVYRTLINKGIVGSIRGLPTEIMSADSIGAGRPGPAPADLKISETDYAFGKANPSTTLGRWVQICAVLKVNYSDNGVGEDFWTSNSDKSVPGVHLKVYDSQSVQVFSGFTSDGITSNRTIGCSDWIFATNYTNWTIRVESRARVDVNTIHVFKDSTKELYRTWGKLVPLVQGGQNFVAIPNETRESSALAAATQAIFQNRAGLSGKTFKIHTGANDNYHSTYDGKIRLTVDGSRRKFTTVHEMGHSLLFRKLDSNFGPYDASHQTAAPCHTSPGFSHAMTSKEFAIAAFHEGFANFYAVQTWNNHNEQHAVYARLGQVFDAEGGGIWMRYNCAGPYPGFGNEWDWMRFFWDFHTNPSPAGAPFDDIVGIIALAPPLSETNVYSRLVSAAGNFNNGVWSYAFIYQADMNGINY